MRRTLERHAWLLAPLVQPVNPLALAAWRAVP